ncbi:MAG TPA: DNA polymerase IV [Anaerolineae bacterium]|nr:DNA polymerase IV [Anaerolineae bacterium]
MSRTILHVDLDAFFVSVELLERPDLRGKPVAVGGQPDQRGVIASASYEARKFGVRSALPTRTAFQLCPELILLPGRHDLYEQHSHKVMLMLREITPQIEQISIDEAFLDITGTELRYGSPEKLARLLHERIRDEFGLPCSIGVASNKLVAKIATEQAKPNNIRIVPAGDEAAFLAPLPVRALWGVGPKTAEILKGLGIETIGQIAQARLDMLAYRLGKNGADDLVRRAHGIDDSPVEDERIVKQISQETTFVKDIADVKQLRATLLELSEGVGRHLREDNLSARTIAIKLRYGDFSTFTRQTTLPQPTNLDQDIFEQAWLLFERNWNKRAVRLIGVAARQLNLAARQLDLFEQRDDRAERLTRTVDDIRHKYGAESLKRGSTLRPSKRRDA